MIDIEKEMAENNLTDDKYYGGQPLASPCASSLIPKLQGCSSLELMMNHSNPPSAAYQAQGVVDDPSS